MPAITHESGQASEGVVAAHDVDECADTRGVSTADRLSDVGGRVVDGLARAEVAA